MKILQIGDMHLGAKLTGVKKHKAVKEIRKSIVKSVDKLEKMLIEEDYKGLVLAGDIFDSENISDYWINRVSELISAVMRKGGFVVYATGNHDYFVNENTFTNLPNTGLFKLFYREEFEKIEVRYKDQVYKIHGIGYNSSQPALNINDMLPDACPDSVNIVVFHGDVFDGDTNLSSSDYLYANSRRISAKGYDYVAVGHVHDRKIIGGNIVYTGCTFPQGFDELTEKGVMSIKLEPNFIAEFIKLSNYRLANLKLKITSHALESIITEIRKKVIEKEEETKDKTYFKIKVQVAGLYIDEFKTAQIEEDVFYDDKDTSSIIFENVENFELDKEVSLPSEIKYAVLSSGYLVMEKLANDRVDTHFIASNQSVKENLSNNFNTIIDDIYAVLQGEKYVD